MDDPLQVVLRCLAFAASAENNLPQRLAIDLTVRIEHRFAEPFPDGVPHRSPSQDFMSDLVAIDQRHVVVAGRYPTGNRTFTRADPPDNSNHGNVRAF